MQIWLQNYYKICIYPKKVVLLHANFEKSLKIIYKYAQKHPCYYR